MTRTLLIDLDNTLLWNENNVFIPALVKAFSESMSDLIKPIDLGAHFALGIQAMMSNQRPDQTLVEVLQEDFSERSGIPAAVLSERTATFYRTEYPSLQELTQPVEGAAAFFEEAGRRGYRLAIATNPLYPRSAIEMRLAWANLQTELYPPAIITSFEWFHFTKPAPAFFAEALAQMGWPEGDVIVIGDDPFNDIAPATLIGVPSYQVVRTPHEPGEKEAEPNGRGSLYEFFSWLDGPAEGKTAPEFDRPSAMRAILRSTPAALDTLLRQGAPQMLDFRAAEHEWNVTEIICHLRDVEREVQLPRIKQVMESSNPQIKGRNTDAWADQRGYCFQNPQLAYREFLEVRLETLEVLDGLVEQDWDRPARHTIFGPTNLRELVSIAAAHDRMHINQAWRLKEDFIEVNRGVSPGPP